MRGVDEDTSDNDDNVFFLVLKKPVELWWLYFSGFAVSLLFSWMHILFLCALNVRVTRWIFLSATYLRYNCLWQAFMDVEKDLTERETPMDRLICGDVGFGKTEVAMRAIFCVVLAGKQAMVLAPTIVLAKQHFDVISERFSCYPNIKVGLLSRYQVRKYD